MILFRGKQIVEPGYINTFRTQGHAYYLTGSRTQEGKHKFYSKISTYIVEYWANNYYQSKSSIL